MLLSTSFLFAQGSIIFPTAPVDNNGIVDFTFDLVGGGAEYNLSVEVDFNDGMGWNVIDPLYITGQLENVEPATGIALQWDAMSSFPGRVTSNAELKVTARHVCGTAFTFNYRGSDVTYETILIDYGGTVGERCWFDRNLGASQQATSSTDADAYGDLFQWGRAEEGHQLRGNTDHHSGQATTPSPNTGADWDEKFITTTSSSSDWLETQNDDLWQGVDGTNNPCPSGWRVPTEAELNAERLSWAPSNNATGTFNNSDLRWPVGGNRNNLGALINVDNTGFVWSSSVSGTNARILYFSSGVAGTSGDGRAVGMSVRCVRNN